MLSKEQIIKVITVTTRKTKSMNTGSRRTHEISQPYSFITQIWTLRPRDTELLPKVTQLVSSSVHPRSHITSHVTDLQLWSNLKLKVHTLKGFAAHFSFFPVVRSLWPVTAAVRGKKTEQKMHSWSRRGKAAKDHQTSSPKSHIPHW